MVVPMKLRINQMISTMIRLHNTALIFQNNNGLNRLQLKREQSLKRMTYNLSQFSNQEWACPHLFVHSV